MLVTVNGEELSGHIETLRTLGETLDVAATVIDPRDVVTQVAIDGQACDPTDETQRSRNLQGAAHVAIHTQSPEEIAATKILDLAGHLDPIIAKLEIAEKQFSLSGEVTQANAALAAASEELRLLLVLEQTLELLPGAEVPRPPSRQISEAAQGMVEAEQRRDWGRVAELVREELLPILHRWRQELRLAQGTTR